MEHWCRGWNKIHKLFDSFTNKNTSQIFFIYGDDFLVRKRNEALLQDDHRLDDILIWDKRVGKREFRFFIKKLHGNKCLKINHSSFFMKFFDILSQYFNNYSFINLKLSLNKPF